MTPALGHGTKISGQFIHKVAWIGFPLPAFLLPKS